MTLVAPRGAKTIPQPVGSCSIRSLDGMNLWLKVAAALSGKISTSVNLLFYRDPPLQIKKVLQNPRQHFRQVGPAATLMQDGVGDEPPRILAGVVEVWGSSHHLAKGKICRHHLKTSNETSDGIRKPSLILLHLLVTFPLSGLLTIRI